MKRASMGLMLGVGLAVGFLAGAAVTTAYSDGIKYDYSQVVAQAGETKITRAMLADRAISRYGGRILETELKNEALVEEAARRANITTTPQEIEKRYTDYMGLLDQYKEMAELFGSKEANSAMPKDLLLQQFRIAILAEKLLKINVTNEEISTCFYDDFKGFYRPSMVKIICIASNSQADALKAWTGLKDGKDPSELAVLYNSDKEMQEAKGDLGWLPKNKLIPDMANELFKDNKDPKPKDFTKVFKFTDSLSNKPMFAVCYVEDFRPARETKLENVKPVVEFYARMKKLSKLQADQNWFKEQEKVITWKRLNNLFDQTGALEVPKGSAGN